MTWPVYLGKEDVITVCKLFGIEYCRPILEWHADCIFTDWAGNASPLGLFYSSIANVVDTVFRNMWLHVELADVSFGGVAHFENATLANVSLSHGKIVSTSNNDYTEAVGFMMEYYAEDDADFDVEFTPVPLNQRGMFGEEFRVGNQTMSDCVILPVVNGTILPGCPPSSVQRRLELAMRGIGPQDDSTFAADWYNIDDYLLTKDDAWLLAVEAELGPLPPPPEGWPPFTVKPIKEPVERTSLAPQLVEAPWTMVPALGVMPLAVATPRQAPIREGTLGKRVILVVVAAVLVSIAAAAALWAARTLSDARSLQPRPEVGMCCSADVFAHPWPRRFPYWTVRLLQHHTCSAQRVSCRLSSELLQLRTALKSCV